MLAVLGDPRTLAVLVRFETSFDALFEHYHTPVQEETQFMNRVKAAQPYPLVGRQPRATSATMSYVDFLRSVWSF